MLLKNLTPTGKLDDKWEKDPYIVAEIPIQDIPVYKVKKETGKGREKTLHRNLLLPLMSIPYTDEETQREPQQKRPLEVTRENRTQQESLRDEVPTGTTRTAQDGESDSSTDSEKSIPKYVPPCRRPVPTPRVRVRRPVHPTNDSRVVCEGQGSSTRGRSTVWESRENQPRSLNMYSTGQTSLSSSDFRLSDRSQSDSTSHREFSRHELPSNSFDINISGNSYVSETPVVAQRANRPQRYRKPPDRYGEWVTPIDARIESNPNHVFY